VANAVLETDFLPAWLKAKVRSYDPAIYRKGVV